MRQLLLIDRPTAKLACAHASTSSGSASSGRIASSVDGPPATTSPRPLVTMLGAKPSEANESREQVPRESDSRPRVAAAMI